MSSHADLRLARAAISALEWLQSHRSPRGGAVLKHEVERRIQECLVTLDRNGHVDSETRENLSIALACFAEYLELIR